jgi:hypothetical protein
MFIGHFGLGLGLKRVAPTTSLGTLFMAVQFVDLLWPMLLLLGLEHVVIAPGSTSAVPLDFVDYPISHSLLTMVGWGVLFGVVYWLVRKSRTGAIVCGIAVVSHWFLDLLMHRPDLPLYPGDSPLFGLGLWNSVPASLALEAVVFGVGVWLYTRTTRAVDRTGVIGFWSLMGFLAVVHVGNMFGPPPPSPEAIAWAGHAQWLLIVWAYWVDKHRAVA